MAIRYAKMMADNSPDAVVVSGEGLKLGWEGLGVYILMDGPGECTNRDNIQELDALT